MKTLWQAIRAVFFYCGLVTLVLLMSLSVCLVGLFPFRYRQLCLTFGNKLIMGWLRVTCGVKVKVIGLENIPDDACVCSAITRVLGKPFSYSICLYRPVLFLSVSYCGYRFLAGVSTLCALSRLSVPSLQALSVRYSNRVNSGSRKG